MSKNQLSQENRPTQSFFPAHTCYIYHWKRNFIKFFRSYSKLLETWKGRFFNFNINYNFTNFFIFHWCLKIDTFIQKYVCIIKKYLLLKYYFEGLLIYNWRYYRQTIFNQLYILVFYVDIICLCHSVANYEKSMWCGLNVMWGGCASISSTC